MALKLESEHFFLDKKIHFLSKLYEKILPKFAENTAALAIGATLIGLIVAAIVGFGSKFTIDKISECSSQKMK